MIKERRETNSTPFYALTKANLPSVFVSQGQNITFSPVDCEVDGEVWVIEESSLPCGTIFLVQKMRAMRTLWSFLPYVKMVCGGNSGMAQKFSIELLKLQRP